MSAWGGMRCAGLTFLAASSVACDNVPIPVSDMVAPKLIPQVLEGPGPHTVHAAPGEGREIIVTDSDWPFSDAMDGMSWDRLFSHRLESLGDRAIDIATVGEFAYTVPVTVTVHPDADADGPDLDLDRFDHVAEASFRIETGTLQIGDLISWRIAPGSYRARLGISDIATADADDDRVRYWLDLWPAETREPTVHKWWRHYAPKVPDGLDPDRRNIIGTDAYLQALETQKLQQIATRVVPEEDRDPRHVAIGYEDQRFLKRSKDGSLWEYWSPFGHGGPVLTEITRQEAEAWYGVTLRP